MDAETWGCSDELVAALSAATRLLEDLPVQVCRLGSHDLGMVLGVADPLAAAASASRFTLTSEADQRGDVMASTSGTVRQWVADRCPTLDARDAGVVAKAVTRLNTPALETARAAVSIGRLSIPAGVAVAAELADLRPLLQPGAAEPVLAGLVAIGATHGSAGVRGFRVAMLARYGLGEVIQDEQDRRAGLTNLSCGHDIGGGITEYRMRLTPESRAVVEAAINTLTAPSPDDAASDVRTGEQRRGDALVDVCRRAVTLGAMAADVDTEQALSAVTPLGIKASVLVTIGYDDLVARTRPGMVMGGLTSAAVLGPETVRKLACDGGIIPVILGSAGQVLEMGSTRRAFSGSQVKALWLRDRHCSYPGCDVPATWCDAHHVEHWADGGPTDPNNGTLLCNRHHHVVHRDRFHAEITPDGVEWDRVPGSYDRALRDRARDPRAADPEPPGGRDADPPEAA